MKQTGQLKRAEAQMAPGVITLDGFLGTDRRNLTGILVADEAAVGRLGLTHAAIAEKMASLRDRGMAGLGDFVRVDGGFEVRVESVRGKLPCPFGDPGMHPKTNITVRNIEAGEEITYTDLGIHMIAAHGFYQGTGAPFRTAPEDLARVLAIGPVKE